MKHIVVSQRVVKTGAERRDALDQQWAVLMARHGLHVVPMPNRLPDVHAWLDAINPVGIILSGGNDLPHLISEGDAVPERDATEAEAYDWAISHGRPMLGVCHGCQVLADRAGASIEEVQGHVGRLHKVRLRPMDYSSFEVQALKVNSFHRFAIRPNPEGSLDAWAWAEDGTVEGFNVPGNAKIVGIMWHPERPSPSQEFDAHLIEMMFGGDQ